MPSGSRTGSWNEYYKTQQDTIAGRKNMGGSGYGGRTGQDIARAIFGGPVGWYEISQGKGLFGGSDPFDGTTINDNMTQSVYDSMSEDEWNSFAKMSTGEQDNYIVQRTKDLVAQGKIDAEQAAAEKKLKDEKDARDTQQKDIISKVQKFADAMNMPVEELMQKDGFAQALNKQTFQNSMAAGLNTGAGAGGLSQVNAQDSVNKALIGYQMQRQQMGQQAYDNAFGMINNMGLQATDLARYNQGLDFQMQEATAMRRAQEYQQKMGQASGLGGMIGGIAGAYFGGPTGAAMGQSIGSNMAGQRYQSSNPYKSYQFKYPSATGGSGGLGGSKYGGNY